MEWSLSKLTGRVAKGVMRDDLATLSNNYADYVNEALKEFQDKRSWRFMRKEADVTLLQGQKTVALPDDFKELQEKVVGSPVSFVLNDPNNPGAMFPIDVNFEQQEEKRLWIFAGQLAVWFGTMRLFLKRLDVGAELGMEIPATEDMKFHVRYYGYLPDLEAPTDESPIANAWPTMVVAKAKALALSDVNDPVAATLEQYSETKFKQASLQDSRSDLNGRPLHM